MKRKIALLALLAVFAAIAASGTIAYFTSETKAHNVITSGGIDIDIVETMKVFDENGNPAKDENGNDVVTEFPSVGSNIPNNLPPVMPGTSMSKIVQVANKQEEAWIRAFVTIGISDEVNQKNLLLQVPNAEGEMVDVVSFDLGEDWVLGEDYYYYYTKPVAAYEENKDPALTSPLFEEVKFAKEMGNEYQNCKIIIDVAAEAIQVANNELESEIPASGTAAEKFDVIKTVWPEYKENN